MPIPLMCTDEKGEAQTQTLRTHLQPRAGRRYNTVTPNQCLQSPGNPVPVRNVSETQMLPGASQGRGDWPVTDPTVQGQEPIQRLNKGSRERHHLETRENGSRQSARDAPIPPGPSPS